jgi:hypothetical protein
MKSKFKGECKACLDAIAVGAEIVYDEFSDGWVHEECKVDL